MGKIRIYDVDQAVNNNRPMVRVRGQLYYVRDLTVAERMSSLLSTFNVQEQLEENESDPQKLKEALDRLGGQLVQQVLEGVPDEVAFSITEREFKAITNAINNVRNLDVPIEGKEEEGPVAVGQTAALTSTPQ